MDLLDQCGDARGVRGCHGRARQVTEGRLLLPGRQVRPDALAGGRDVDRVLAVVGETGALECGGGRVGTGGQLEGGDGQDGIIQHGGHVDAARDVTLDGRAVNVVGGFVVGRRVVVVVVRVAFGGEVNDAVVLRVAHRARGCFEARGLGGFVGHPEGVGVHVVAGVGHVDVVFGRPVEGAGHVFGVEGSGLVRCLDGDEGRVGRYAVDAVGVVGGGDGSGDVRAVVVVILPGGGVLVGDAVDLAAHRQGRVDAVLEVLVVLVDLAGLLHRLHLVDQ